MVRKHNIVRNEELTAQKIIILSSTEQAMQTEAINNIHVHSSTKNSRIANFSNIPSSLLKKLLIGISS